MPIIYFTQTMVSWKEISNGMKWKRGKSGIKWMTVGFLSFETTQRAICQIVGQWILFHYFYRTFNVASRSQNHKSTFHRAGLNDKMRPNKMKWLKIPPNGWYISTKKNLILNKSLGCCCHRIKSVLSRFYTGKKTQSKVLRD